MDGSPEEIGVDKVGMKTRMKALVAGAAVLVAGGTLAAVAAASAAGAAEPAALAAPVATVTYTPYPEDPAGFADLAEIGIAVGDVWESDWADAIDVAPASGDLADLSVLVITYVDGSGDAPSLSDFDGVADRFGVEFELVAGSYWG